MGRCEWRTASVVFTFSFPYGNNQLVYRAIAAYYSRTGIINNRIAHMNNILPYGNILSPQDLGDILRQQRKAQGATQAELAALCGVGVRFISELENGKPTIELGKVLQVLQCVGLELSLRPRGWTNPGVKP